MVFRGMYQMYTNRFESAVTAKTERTVGLQTPSAKLFHAITKNAAVALATALISSATWAACARITQDVGYDFTFGAKTGVAAPDAGTCVPGATTIASPGDDFCSGAQSDDFVVRTNDTAVATLKYTIEAGTTINNYTLVVDIPKTGEAGAVSSRTAGLTIATWDAVPAFCSGPGSQITNGGTRLTCNLGTVSNPGGQRTVATPANIKISSRALNGEKFDLKTTDRYSDGSFGSGPTALAACVPAAPTAAPQLIVSARPKIDIKTNVLNYSATTYQGVQGYFMDFFVSVDALNGTTVGGEAVQSPLNFNVGLRSDVQTTGVKFINISQYQYNNNTPQTTILTTQAATGIPAGNGLNIPVSLAPVPANANCVAEFLVPGGPCQETPLTNPTRLNTSIIRYFVPISAFPNGINQINFENFLNSDGSGGPVGITTPSASGVGGPFVEPVSENIAPISAVRTVPGTYAKNTAQFLDTQTERPPGSPTDSPATLNEPGGQAAYNSCYGGSCKQYPTKNVESLIQLFNKSPFTHSTLTGSTGGVIICDKFDNRGMVLTPKPRSAGANPAAFPTNNPGNVISALIYLNGSQEYDSLPDGYTVEVATSPATPLGYPANSQNCGDSDAVWVSPNGITDFSAFNMVRAKAPRMYGPFTPGASGIWQVAFFFTVPLNAPNGAYIGNQLKIQAGDENFGGTGPSSWTAGTFNPLTNDGVPIGERFQVVKALVRTQKTAINATGAEVSAIGAGRTVTFVLSPSYTAAPGVPSPNSDISVVDVLPLPMQYVSGTARSGSPTAVPLEPNSVTLDASGRQVLTWILPNVALNSAIAPILFDARVPTTAQNGTVITNVVTVAAPLVDQSTAAERSADKSLTVQTSSGTFVDKSVSLPAIPRNGTFSYTLSLGNLLNAPLLGAELIDVLPKSASPINSPQNNFAGTIFLANPVAVPLGGEVYYTKAAPGTAPIVLTGVTGGGVGTALAPDYAIVPSAATGWCTFTELGANPACPATVAAATAIRIKFATIGATTVQNVTLNMGTANNLDGNLYVNRFSAKAGVQEALFSNDVQTRVKQSKISGKVYVDNDLTNQFSVGDSNIPGVTVTLTGTDSTGAPINRTTQTDASGNYSFGDLFPGTYSITETQPAAYSSAGTNAPGSSGGTAGTPNEFTAITLGASVDALSYNFGEVPLLSISGKVFLDKNLDGVSDAGDSPLPASTPPITLTLCLQPNNPCTGANIVTTTIANPASGAYSFPSVPPGVYYVVETQPVAYGSSSPNIQTVTLVATPATNVDFAETGASLSGTVYADTAANGVLDTPADPGIPGVAVKLCLATSLPNCTNPVASTTTGPNGTYTFANVPAPPAGDTYVIVENEQTGPLTTYGNGTATVGTLVGGTALANGSVVPAEQSSASTADTTIRGISFVMPTNLITGTPPVVGTKYNFGELPTGSISGAVFIDRNFANAPDGTIDPATDTPLLNNATTTITLCRVNPGNAVCPTSEIAGTTTTSPAGTYTFADVPPGNYFVVETQPAGYGSSSPNVVPVTRVGTTPVANINFADTLAEIKGTVYQDNDASGTLSGGDTGIPSTAVQLCRSTDTTCSSPVQTTSTSPNGTYTFANLLPPIAGETYYIKEGAVAATLQNGTTTVGNLSVSGATAAPVGTANSPASTINAITWAPTAAPANGPSASGTNYNFGELPQNAISGRVILDANRDGLLTTAETGIPSKTTTVKLCRVNENPCAPANTAQTAITDPITGAYAFTNVTPGVYYVVETQPSGYASSTPNTLPVTMASSPISDINFLETAADISGTVYQDNNASGAIDLPGDTPIQGVAMRLCLTSQTAAQCASSPVATATTSITGSYTFANVPAPAPGDSYLIVENEASAPLLPLANGTATAGSLTGSGTPPANGTIVAAEQNSAFVGDSKINAISFTMPTTVATGTPVVGTGYNFGELPVTTISGAVILDRNFDGLNNGTDGPLPVTTTLTLCRTNSNPCVGADIVSTTTSSPTGGTYTFSNVTPGNYFVIQTQPAGYASTSPNAIPASVVGTTPVTNVNFLESGAQISGVVYKDVNYNGTYNPTGATPDIPLAGVVVKLCTTNTCASGTVIATSTTTAAGLYEFKNLPAPPPGQQYFILEDQATVPPTPTVLSDGTTNVGTFTTQGGAVGVPGTPVQTPSRVDGISWTPATTQVNGTASVVGTNFNFGEIDGLDIAGRVYYDKDRNGGSNEPAGNGINSVVITLCRTAAVPCPASSVVGTTTTAVDGNYTFTKVPPGNYFVQESQPVGYGSTPTTAAPSATDVRPINLSGSNLTGIDFADTLSSLAGLVYLDNNGNQVRDGTTEPTRPGVTVTLTGIDATGAPVTKTVVTNASGTYVFEDLKAGTYTVSETQDPTLGNGAAHPGSTGGTGAPNSNVISAIALPVSTDSVNNNFGDVPKTGGVSGSLWRDNDHDRVKDADESVLAGWTVELYRTPTAGGTPTFVTSVVSSATGFYSIGGQEVGPGYSVRFRAPGGVEFGGAVNGEQGPGSVQPNGGTQTANGLTGINLQPNTVIPQQSLPVDPSGVVYDSDTRLPVPGARVNFAPIGTCAGYNPAIHLFGGAANASQVVGPDGAYQFLLNPGAPACQYGITTIPPASYQADPRVPPQATPLAPPNRPPNDPFLVAPNSGAPQGDQPTTWYNAFNLNANSRDIINNHIPLVANNRPVLFITKVAGKTTVELGDNVKYTVKVKYASGPTALPVLRIVDSMPAGFKLIPDTSFVSVPTGATVVPVPAANIIGAPGAVVTYNIPLPGGVFNVGQEMELTYRVRVGVGSLQGDGINRAQASSTGAIRSNVAQAKVKVNSGVFTSDACIVGKIYVDCNNNHIQDAEEIGVPGVRLYMQDGIYMVSDSEGKYSICGLEPKSHVLKVDQLTLPRGTRLTTTSNRNLGNGDSLWLDLKNGEMQQADFAIGSCSNTVLEQVKARRAQGGVRSIDNESKGGTSLKFEGKNANYPDQGTDSANQPLVQPRPPQSPGAPPPGEAENNTPVPQLPAASSNTPGNNIRLTK
jgi:uncharacterized repeat protein (TIGR01451 family)